MWITSALLSELEAALLSKLAAPSIFKNKGTLYLYFRLQLSRMRARAQSARYVVVGFHRFPSPRAGPTAGQVNAQQRACGAQATRKAVRV